MGDDKLIRTAFLIYFGAHLALVGLLGVGIGLAISYWLI